MCFASTRTGTRVSFRKTSFFKNVLCPTLNDSVVCSQNGYLVSGTSKLQRTTSSLETACACVENSIVFIKIAAMEVPSNESMMEPTENKEEINAERVDRASSTGTTEQRHAECTDDLLSIWETVAGSEDKTHRKRAFEQTIMFLKNQIEQLVSSGVDAFHRSEKVARELKALREEYQSKEIELERMRASEEKSRTTVSVS